MYYKDFDTLDAKLTELIATYNGQQTLLDPKLKKAIDDSYGLISLEKKDMKKKILAFYNFMYELFDEHVEKMSYNFDYYTELPVNALAMTFGSYQGGCTMLGKTWNDKKLLKHLYNIVDEPSGELEATFVHEFGHAIHNFLAVRADQFPDFTLRYI